MHKVALFALVALLIGCTESPVTPLPPTLQLGAWQPVQGASGCASLTLLYPSGSRREVQVGQSAALTMTPIEGLTTDLRARNGAQVFCAFTTNAVVPGVYTVTLTGQIGDITINQDTRLEVKAAALVAIADPITATRGATTCTGVGTRTVDRNPTPYTPVTTASALDVTLEPEPGFTLETRDDAKPLCLTLAPTVQLGRYTLNLQGRADGIGFNQRIVITVQ